MLSCSIYAFLHRQKTAGTLIPITFISSLLLLWMYSGQGIGQIFNYLYTGIQITKGYSDAMSAVGNNDEIILYLFAATSILISIVINFSLGEANRIFFQFILFFLFLFVSFKTGFVRHDAHAINAGLALLYSGLLLFVVSPNIN